jgi:hypothetical protein
VRRSRLAVALALALVVPAGSHLIRPAVAAACAPTSIVASLDEYVGSAATAFFWAAEGQTKNVSILRGGHDCLRTRAEVSYQATKVTADAGLDHNLPSTETWTDLGEPPAPSAPNEISHTRVPVTAASDDSVEDAVEISTFKLLNTRAPGDASFRLIDPTQASVFIVDTDGGTRFRLSHSSYSQNEGVTGASIPVIRAGPATETETIGYTIKPSETNPATPDDDYTAPAGGVLSFAANERVKTIPVTVINDGIREPTESFVVSLTGTQLAPEEPTSATFSILDNEESIPPTSKFHHPKHKTRYDYDSRKGWYLREIHVFTSDQGSGVVRTQMALRKKMQSGKCSWWAGSRFERRPCAQKKWLRMKGDFDFYFYRIKELKPTVGTNIKNYTAFSRAVDGAGNVENTFKKGRNANTFTIAR